MLHDWMTANLSYDKNIVTKQNGKSRMNIHKDSQWNVYYTHTGICRDFVNIYAIMCRELDIPCVSIDNPKHAWTLVYIDGQWIETDLTKDIQRKVYTEDITDVTSSDKTICYNTFLNHWSSGRLDGTDLGYDIYTEDHLINGFPY